MAYIKRPTRGEKVLQSLFDSVNSIIDYLPTITVRGDNYSTSVEHSSAGTIIHAKQNANPDQTGGKKSSYYAGSGLVLTSGNVFNVEVDNSTVKIVDNKLSCIVSGGGGGGGTTILCGDFSYPNYFAMSDVELANVANYVPCGIGISWVLPVSAGTRPCFYSTAGDGTAFGVFTSDVNEPNPQRIQMSNGIPVAPSTNGWCRISVFDNGAAEGSCLRFTSHFPAETPSYDYWNYTTPLYRFHGYKKYYGDDQTVFISSAGIICANVWQYTGLGDVVVDNQNHTISYDGSGGGDVDLSWKTSYPDIQALRNGDYQNYSINGDYYTTSGQGISWLIPVQSGYNYKFYANNGDGKVWGTFASSLDVLEGQDERIDPIANGIPFVPSTDGWARISVFDDGSNEGECLRFFKYTDSDSSLEGMPLYRFHGFQKYTEGAGIKIESGAIRNMIQPGKGLTSTALTDPNSNPYNPTITGIAFDLSTKFYDDLVTISGRTGNKVLSSSNGVLTWATNVTGGSDKFYAPNYAKLPATDAGETALGLGNTYVVPVKSGNTIHYSADGGVVVAQWLPCEGSSTAIKDVPTSTPYLTTTEDGFVRISVIDDGSLTYGCVRLHVGNKSLPLHKFARFSSSSGYTYTGDRYINVKYTEEQTVEGQTVQVPLTNPIISCTLTGGNFVEIQQRDSNNNLLEYPRINCTLSEGTGISISEDGIISNTCIVSSVYGLLEQGPNIQLTHNDETGITTISGAGGGGGVVEYTGISPIVVNNATHQISYNGSGGGGGGMPWPNYANLTNYSTELSCNTDYGAGYSGGWLRISYKGEAISGCYGVNIDYNQIGLYTVGETSNVQQGCTWLLPIPPYSHFMVVFPSAVTHVYFDSQTWTSQQTEEYYSYICGLAEDAWDSESNAESYKGAAEDDADQLQYNYQQYVGKSGIWSTSEYESYKDSAASNAEESRYYATQTSGIANDAISQCESISPTQPTQNRAEGYRNNAIEAAEYADEYAHQAEIEADRAMYYYVLRRDHNNKTWYNNNYQAYNSAYYPYDYSLEYPYHN